MLFALLRASLKSTEVNCRFLNALVQIPPLGMKKVRNFLRTFLCIRLPKRSETEVKLPKRYAANSSNLFHLLCLIRRLPRGKLHKLRVGAVVIADAFVQLCDLCHFVVCQ